MDNLGGNYICSSKTLADPDHIKDEPLVSEELSDFDNTPHQDEDLLPNFTPISDNSDDDEEDEANPINNKSVAAVVAKKKKKKSNNTKPTSRKPKNKDKEDSVRIAPMPRFDKSDDHPDMNICLSKAFKADKVELSEDRLSAGSCKGYRMVRSSRGVTQGAWFFEIKLVNTGLTGHTRLGWSTDKGELEAPVGYDGNSFGYRDIDGSKIHKALRDKYGDQGYGEGDVIGCYINLPQGDLYTPNAPSVVWYKGQKCVCAPDAKQDPPKVIPGSEISFFKNGKCQGVAFKDLYGGRYYAAASMYTLPNQPNCVVRFNFGPDFESFPQDFNERPLPRPMIEVPYHGFDYSYENGKPLVTTPRMFPMLKLVKEQDFKIAED